MKIIALNPVDTVEFYIDEYLPFSAVFKKQTDSIPVYYRIGDFNTNLIEIGINSETGCICTFSIVMLDSISYGDYHNESNLPCEIGLPVFELINWPENRFKDRIFDVRVTIKDKVLKIIMSPDNNEFKIYKSNNVNFCCDALGNLLWMEFLSIDRESILDLSFSI